MARKRVGDRALTMPEGRRIPRPAAEPREHPAAPPAAPPPAALVKAGAELASLVSVVRACYACSRASDRRAFGSGHPRARVLLVKDSPSDSDLRAETAFVDEAEALERAFDRLNIPRWWVYGSTAVRCGTRRPTPGEVHACAGHLLVEVEAIAPGVLVAFGESALDAVRALDGRCGIEVPEDVPGGRAVPVRADLHLLCTEPLPAGITDPDAKRRLWRDLQTIPSVLARTEP